jgi:dUTP pyrophosphatase
MNQAKTSKFPEFFANGPLNGVEIKVIFESEKAKSMYSDMENGFAYDEAAGFDLRAYLPEKKSFICYPGRTVTIPTGMRIWINNPTLAGFIFPRSGLGCNEEITLGNSVGVIDSDYQGYLRVCLRNHSTENEFEFSHGMRIAQLVIMPIVRFKMTEVSDFESETNRGNSGFGSSGFH